MTLTTTITTTGSPTGTETFYDGITALGSTPVSGNTASLHISTLTAGPHSLIARYSGNASVSASQSMAVNEAVSKANTATSINSSPNPGVIGQTITYQATVSPQFSGTPTGTARFQDGITIVATVTLSGGTASYSTSYASMGKHSITVTYLGDANFGSSVSPILSEQVKKK